MAISISRRCRNSATAYTASKASYTGSECVPLAIGGGGDDCVTSGMIAVPLGWTLGASSIQNVLKARPIRPSMWLNCLASRKSCAHSRQSDTKPDTNRFQSCRRLTAADDNTPSILIFGFKTAGQLQMRWKDPLWHMDRTCRLNELLTGHKPLSSSGIT